VKIDPILADVESSEARPHYLITVMVWTALC
jgi:hypothetical protein